MRPAIATTAFLAAVTVVATASTWQLERQRAEADFEFRAHEITERVRVRLRSYAQVLRGGAGLFAASDEVTRADWRAYVASLALENGYPGFQGIGFSARIPPEKLAEHVATLRAEGFHDYDVFPAGERDVYHAIVYLEPFDWRNQRAFGYDMFSEPTRREAMARARDTGDAALSGPIRLVQETDVDVQAGFNLYFPVYRNGMPTGTVDERRAALLGFVYSPFRMHDLLEGVLGAEPRALRYEIRDTGDPDHPLYESSLRVEDAAFTLTTTLAVGGRTWALEFEAPPGFGDRSDRRRPWLVLVGGLAFSLLAGLAVWALRSRRQRGQAFANVIQSALDGVVLIDGADRILSFNPAAERMFGWSRAEVVGRTLAETIIPPQYRDMHRRALADAVRTGRGRLEGRTLEVDALRRDGSTFPVEISVARTGTRPLTFSGFIRDVSERRNRQLALMRMNAELEERVAERTRELEAFAYSVSHDLRGPLRAIDGFSSELERQYADRVDDAGRHFLARIRAAAGRMSQLIDDLLKLSRLMQASMAAEEVDLSALARTVVSQLQAAEPDRAVDVRIADTRPVVGDARLLRALLENLLGNAWKFSSKTDRPVIEFGEEAGVYFVRDNGAGFDPAFADKMFAPFQRLHTDAEFPGTGIGLATVQRIVSRHRGTIRAEGEVGKGATFRFTIGEVDG